MNASCYRVRVPEGLPLTGFTAAGHRVSIPPGEHHVHRLPLKPAWGGGVALRFVGAHGTGSDVHIKLPAGAEINQALPLEVLAAEAF